MGETSKIVFGVQVFHNYYEQNNCTCIQFEFGAATKKLAGRYKFNLLQKTNGFELYCTTNDSITTLLNYLIQHQNETLFDFKIRTNNSNFYNFTDLPIDWSFQLSLNSSKTAPADQTKNIPLAIDLVKANDPNQLGSLKVNFSDLIAWINTGVTPKYSITFSARLTQWQYFIVNKNSVPLSNPHITGKSGVIFEAPQTVTIPTGEQALLFSSGATLLPFNETPTYKFDLVNYSESKQGNDPSKKTTNTKTIFKNLPNPNPSKLGIYRSNGIDQIFSPMYIYL